MSGSQNKIQQDGLRPYLHTLRPEVDELEPGFGWRICSIPYFMLSPQLACEPTVSSSFLCNEFHGDTTMAHVCISRERSGRSRLVVAERIIAQ